MSATLVVWLVLGGTAALLVVVLAPWRSPRRDALTEEDVFRALSGDGAEPEADLG